jgi:spore maturation protein SpmB
MPLTIPPGSGGGPPLNPLALLIWGVLSTFADAVENTALYAYAIFGDLGVVAYDSWNYLTGIIVILQNLAFAGVIPFFLDVLSGVQSVVDKTFETITDIFRTIGITFRDVALWANRIRDVRNRLIDVVTAIANWIEAFEADPFAAILSLLAPLLDPVGRALGNLYGFFEGTGYNPWDWIRANTPDIWTAFDSLFTAIRDVAIDWLLAKITGILDWLLSIATAVLDPVGRFLANLYGLLRGTGENPWDWIRVNTPDIWTAFDSLFQALWWAFQDWLDAALAGIIAFLPDLALWLDFLREVGPHIRAFRANPWEYLFALARGRLWPLVERWLVEVWDGAA